MRRCVVGVMMVGGLLMAPPHGAAAAPGAATLDARSFSAAAPAETLLHVTAPGRFAISVHSATGTALSLVDMMTGPTPDAGTPGSADGRLDTLLDTGTYKLRLHPAAAAHGDVTLAVAPFHDAAPPAVMPANAETDATLGDLQLRSFWFSVADANPVRLEAAGRALADFRLWRNGRELVAGSPNIRIIEPTHGHPLRDLLFNASLPPGVYLATAYGGPALAWADGGKELPFHLRAGAPDALRAGWAGGRIGPFGSELSKASGRDTLFQLNAQGPATLRVDDAEASIDIKSRVPVAELRVAARQADHWIEVSAPSGTDYQLRAQSMTGVTSVTGPGRYFVTVNAEGQGGDEVPATIILARSKSAHGWTVAGSNAPDIGPGQGWHHRFNIAGDVTILFHAVSGGRIAAKVTGMRLGKMELGALDVMETHPPEQPQTPGVWNVAAGWYALALAPEGNAQGVADVTIGPPGLEVELAPPAPAAPSVSFGVQSLDWNESLHVIGNGAPAGRFSLDARAAPVALDAGPLRLSQEPGQALDIPIQPDTGRLAAVEYGRGPVPVSYDAAAGIARLPAPDHPRLVALFRDVPPEPPVMPTPEAEAARARLRDNAPRFFDLAENATASFTLTVGAGGLFRVETLGRLHTSGSVGSRFSPELDHAEANGVGENMLLQGFLRAGQYHVDVTSMDSAGHAGIIAAPAPLLTTQALLPGGTVHAALPAGTGLVIPIDIAQAGSYRIELPALSGSFNARLEDAEGWPFAANAPFDTDTEDLRVGHYRLLVSPNATAARTVARLTRVETPPTLTGHGPHALPFDAPQSFVWREPAGRTDPRTPDLWHFALAAPADVTLSITDGMEAFVRGPDGKPVHLVGGLPFTGRLKEGAYSVEATSQGRNDRLDYTLSLSATQMQPGVPRSLGLPASVKFAVASDRVVSLTSFGGTPVRAVLRDGTGRVLGRFGPRDTDWNLALSELLPAGDYTLDLASAAPPPLHPAPANVNDGPSRVGQYVPQEDEADEFGREPDSPPAFASANQEGAAPADEGGGEAQTGRDTELTLTLPDELPAVPLDGLDGPVAALTGGGVHRLLLPPVAPGQLILAGASSVSDLVLSLEQQVGSKWRSRALAHGLAPVLALPPHGRSNWRLSVWAVDGGKLPIRVAAQILTMPAEPGQPHLVATPLEGVNPTLAVAHVALPWPGVLSLSGQAGREVLAAAWPDHQASLPEAGLIAPQNPDIWLIAPRSDPLTLAPVAPDTKLTITLEGSARAVVPAAAGKLTAWIAEAPGQPGLDAGLGMGVADGSAFTLTQQTGASLWNAGGSESLRVTARPVVLNQAPPQSFDTAASMTLPAASATVLNLPPGPHAWHLALPPGIAVIAGWPNPHAVVAWAGHAALSRTLQGDWETLLLVNTNAATAALGVAADAPSVTATLDVTHAVKEFFGAAGSIDIAVPAQAGQRLIIAGEASATFVGDEDRMVRRGAVLAMTGSGRLILQHGAGLVAAWLEGPGAAPWPAATPIDVSLPAVLKLTGPAMQLRFAAPAAGLLRIRSTAPVILSLNGAPPMLCQAGAAASLFLPAGPATLSLIAPQDGDLSGSVALTTTPIRPAVEGLGEPVTVAPGDAALFGFNLARPTRVGLAVRAEPDDATLTLLSEDGHELATGAAMLRDLRAGHYILAASVPATAPTTVLRPAMIGFKPRPDGPPPEVIHFYRELAGLTAPKDAPR